MSNTVLGNLKSSSRLYEATKVAHTPENTGYGRTLTTFLLEPPLEVQLPFPTTITGELILFVLAIEIYRHTKHYVLYLMECQNLNNVGLQTVAEV